MITWKRSLNWNSNAQVWTNLTNSGVTWVNWKLNSWAYFNWSSVLYNSSVNVWITTNYTINWIWKSDTLPTSWSLYNFFIKGDSTYATNWFDCAIYNNSGQYQLYFTHNSGTVPWTSYFWNINTPISWTYYYYSLTFNGSTIQLYINNILISSQSATVTIWNTTNYLYVWYNGIANIRYLNWVMDELVIDNTTWNNVQIKNQNLFYNWFF